MQFHDMVESMNHEPCRLSEIATAQDVVSSTQPLLAEAAVAPAEQPATEPIIAEDVTVIAGGMAAATASQVSGGGCRVEKWTPDKVAIVDELYNNPDLRAAAWKYAGRYMGGSAVDLLHEAFMRIARSDTEIEIGPETHGLVRKAMHSVVMDARRDATLPTTTDGEATRVPREMSADFQEEDFIHLVGEAPAEALVDKMALEASLQQLAVSLGDLEPLTRQIVEARYIEGLSVDEVMEKLGLTRPIVKRRTSYAFRKLREMLTLDAVPAADTKLTPDIIPTE